MDIRSIITQQAEAAGVDPSIALSIAQAESSLNPSAKNKNSSAAGLFQVIDSTWSQYGGAKGKKLDPQENARVGMAILSDNAKMLREVLGRDPSASDLYATHVFGQKGGKMLLSSDENTPISQILSKNAIKANRLQGKTAGDVLAWIESKVPSEKRAKPVSQKTPVPPAADTPFQLGPDPRLVAQGPRDAVAMTADLGPGYQAALGAMYLADANEDKDPDAGELSVAEQYLATGEGPKTASMMKKMADELAMSAPAVVGMADGGMVDDPEAAVFADPSVQTGVTAKEMLKGMGSTYYDMAKGATQATAGLPGDIELFGRILAGQEDPDTVFPTTDEAKAFIDRIAPALGTPTAPEGRTPGEAFGEWMDISGLAKPAVAGAKAAGRAAKNLATSEPAYRMLERMAEPTRASIIRNEPGGFVMPEKWGGDAATGAVHEMLSDVDLQGANSNVINDIMGKKFTSYLRSSMGSPKDPFLNALDQGKDMHFLREIDPILESAYSDSGLGLRSKESLQQMYDAERNRNSLLTMDARIAGTRRTAGTPPESVSKSESGRMLEDLLDSNTMVDKLKYLSPEDFPENTSSILRVGKPEDTIITGYGDTLDAIGAPRLMHGAENMVRLQNHPDIPKDLVMTTQQLSDMSLPDLSRKVSKFETWYAKELGGKARRAFSSPGLKDTGIVNRDGTSWRHAYLSGDAGDDLTKKAVRDIGDFTSWCTAGKDNCDYYLSNGSLYILPDQSNMPMLQAHVGKPDPDGRIALDELKNAANDMDFTAEEKKKALEFVKTLNPHRIEQDIQNALSIRTPYVFGQRWLGDLNVTDPNATAAFVDSIPAEERRNYMPMTVLKKYLMEFVDQNYR